MQHCYSQYFLEFHKHHSLPYLGKCNLLKHLESLVKCHTSIHKTDLPVAIKGFHGVGIFLIDPWYLSQASANDSSSFYTKLLISNHSLAIFVGGKYFAKNLSTNISHVVMDY